MAPIVGSKQAEQLKQDGNNYFQKNRFGAAIDAYTEVIFLLWMLGQNGWIFLFFYFFKFFFGYLILLNALFFRLLLCALMFRYIGQIVLYVIGGGSMCFFDLFLFGLMICWLMCLYYCDCWFIVTGEEWRKIAGGRFSSIIIL